jgi:CDP-paratose 2-epimerase
MTKAGATEANAAPGVRRTRPLLVTGGAGFVGCNLADRLAAEGHDVLVLDALARSGVEENLDWLKRRHPRRISAVIADVRDVDAIGRAVREAEAVFHLAAQVAVTTSLEDPLEDLDVNGRGTLLLLEAARRQSTPPPIILASTNKVYGGLSDVALDLVDAAYVPCNDEVRAHGIDETRPLAFHSPYGCSKGAADQYVLDYAHTFGLETAVLRMSCIYGPRQLGTEDQGWVAHFLISALQGRPLSIYGDGAQVRDILYVADAVEAYVRALERIGRISGHAFNLGGGPANAVSLLQLVGHVEGLLGREIAVSHAEWRPGDQRYFVADRRRIDAALELPAPLAWEAGVARLFAWLQGAGHAPPIAAEAATAREAVR